MPPVRRQRSNRRLEEEEHSNTLPQLDVKYNPDLVASLLKDLSLATEAKCAQITNDSEFMITSMQQMFHLELIKLPTQVKQMSMKRFKEEFGCSLEAVTRGAIAGTAVGFTKPPLDNKIDRTVARSSIYQTPMHNNIGKKPLLPMQTPSMRNPKEGETILSVNGSPLGQFTTVKKVPKPVNSTIIPPTPGVFVPTKTGETVGLEEIDLENMSQDEKLETFQQMQTMMDNMRAMMERLQSQI